VEGPTHPQSPQLDDAHVRRLAAPVHGHQRDALDPLLDGVVMWGTT